LKSKKIKQPGEKKKILFIFWPFFFRRPIGKQTGSREEKRVTRGLFDTLWLTLRQT
jgi:hypothetical protein